MRCGGNARPACGGQVHAALEFLRRGRGREAYGPATKQYVASQTTVLSIITGSRTQVAGNDHSGRHFWHGDVAAALDHHLAWPAPGLRSGPELPSGAAGRGRLMPDPAPPASWCGWRPPVSGQARAAPSRSSPASAPRPPGPAPRERSESSRDWVRFAKIVVASHRLLAG